jgi:signal peptide peptidase SppA
MNPNDTAGPGYSFNNGVAVICIQGQMTKGRSSFGGCCIVDTRRAVRKAVADPNVKSIMLYIDSPGGTVAGTADLAADVAEADKTKPVYAYIDDLGASAAYWVACQSRHIYSNTTAMVGSIGTYTVLEDSTAADAQTGLKYEVISTGMFKGLGADGAVTDALRQDVQRLIDDTNSHFLAAVADGRGFSDKQVRELADGRVHVGDKAKELGLIDEVASLDAAMQAIQTETYKMNASQFATFAAENPDAPEVNNLSHRATRPAKRRVINPPAPNKLNSSQPAPVVHRSRHRRIQQSPKRSTP